MNKVIFCYKIFLVFLFFTQTFSCAQTFKIDENNTVSIVKITDKNSVTNEEYLNRIFAKKKDNKEEILDDIYLSSESSSIIDSFFFDMDCDGLRDIVLIISDDVSSDPIEGNVGPYFMVNVYKSDGNRYLKDDKLSNIFSGGIDKVYDFSVDKPIFKFVYPHKNRSDIQRFVKSDLYIGFIKDGFFNYTLDKKISIYKEPYDFESKMYLIAGDNIKIVGIEGGFISFLFKNKGGKENTYYAKLSDISL